MAELDFSKLTATDAKLPDAPKRTGKASQSPFVAWLRESHENKTGKAVTVPGSNVKEAVYLIRAAANHLNLGSRVVILDSRGKEVKATSETVKDDKGKDKKKTVAPAAIAAKSPRANFTVQFAAKDRRKAKNEDTSDTASESTEDTASESTEDTASDTVIVNA